MKNLFLCFKQTIKVSDCFFRKRRIAYRYHTQDGNRRLIMRITKYNVSQTPDKVNYLVKESNSNYPMLNYTNCTSPEYVADIMHTVYQCDTLPEEHAWVLALTSSCKLIGIFEVSHGVADTSILNPREVFVRLCLIGAVKFIICHNHPSGQTFVSSDDLKTTLRMRECGEMMKIPLIDHIILGDNGTYTSIRQTYPEKF